MNDAVPWASEAYALAAACFALSVAAYALPVFRWGLLAIGACFVVAPFFYALNKVNHGN